MIKQMKQFHLIGTDLRRVRPQSIKISLLNVREIKDDRTSVPVKCTFLLFRKNLFHLYNLLINNYWHTEIHRMHRKAHTLRCAGGAKTISVNLSSGWNESKANRYSVSSVISVCHLNTRSYP